MRWGRNSAVAALLATGLAAAAMSGGERDAFGRCDLQQMRHAGGE
jgi:hypothetical protein